MEKRIFKTLVKENHKHGRNDYVLGRISGIQLAMCVGNPKDEFVLTEIYENVNGYQMKAKCTSEQYEAFSKIVEELYPGLCIFDYKG